MEEEWTEWSMSNTAFDFTEEIHLQIINSFHLHDFTHSLLFPVSEWMGGSALTNVSYSLVILTYVLLENYVGFLRSANETRLIYCCFDVNSDLNDRILTAF